MRRTWKSRAAEAGYKRDRARHVGVSASIKLAMLGDNVSRRIARANVLAEKTMIALQITKDIIDLAPSQRDQIREAFVEWELDVFRQSEDNTFIPAVKQQIIDMNLSSVITTHIHRFYLCRHEQRNWVGEARDWTQRRNKEQYCCPQCATRYQLWRESTALIFANMVLVREPPSLEISKEFRSRNLPKVANPNRDARDSGERKGRASEMASQLPIVPFLDGLEEPCRVLPFKWGGTENDNLLDKISAIVVTAKEQLTTCSPSEIAERITHFNAKHQCHLMAPSPRFSSATPDAAAYAIENVPTTIDGFYFKDAKTQECLSEEDIIETFAMVKAMLKVASSHCRL